MICFHEIGHFITEYKQSGNIGLISIERLGRVMGHVYYEEFIELEEVTRDTLKKKLITALGSLAGEQVVCGDVTCGSVNDISKARAYISQFSNVGAFGFDKINLSGRMVGFTSESFLISENKLLVDIIYKELKQKERLSKREVEMIINLFEAVNITSLENQITY